MNLEPGKKVYFLSDLHLGMFPYEASRQREKEIILWLESVRHETAALFLLGDTFDYWYEFRKVVPKGFVRFLAQIASFTDNGIPVHIFSGNHDVWMFDYLPQETGVLVHHEPMELEINGKKFLVGHGDGLGPGDHTYKWMKNGFRSKLLQSLFSSWLHPNFSMSLGQAWSKARRQQKKMESPQSSLEKDQLYLFTTQTLLEKHYDYFIFGHHHHPEDISLNGNSRYINTGDWLKHNSYAVFDGQDINLCKAPIPNFNKGRSDHYQSL